jgi:hypothetical protein
MVSDDVAKQNFAAETKPAVVEKNDGFDDSWSGWTWFFIFAGVSLVGFAVYKVVTRKPSNPYGRYGI